MVRGGKASLFCTPRFSASKRASDEPPTSPRLPFRKAESTAQPCFPRRGVYRPSLRIRPFACAAVVSIGPGKDALDRQPSRELLGHCHVLYSTSPKPARQLLHGLPMHDATLPGNNLRHRPAVHRPHQHHVRAPEMRDDFDMLAHIPADFSTAMSLVHELLVAAGLEFGTIIGQDTALDAFTPELCRGNQHWGLCRD